MLHTNANKKKPKINSLNSMQTKNQNRNRKYETTLPLCLDKALFKVRKVREAEGNKRQLSC